MGSIFLRSRSCWDPKIALTSFSNIPVLYPKYLLGAIDETLQTAIPNSTTTNLRLDLTDRTDKTEEAVYQEALEIELKKTGIPYEREKPFPIIYDGAQTGIPGRSKAEIIRIIR
jgi:hypothetical protein